MKAIINGARYDTETAERIAEWDNGYTRTKFRWVSEDLYRTRKGNYFIHGRGGPRSRYARKIGDMLDEGSDLRPVTRDQAVNWLEEHRLTDIIEEMFSDSVEDA